MWSLVMLFPTFQVIKPEAGWEATRSPKDPSDHNIMDDLSVALVVKISQQGHNLVLQDPQQIPTYFVFTTIAGLTGVIITLALILIITSSMEVIRRSYFEVFWYTHHLFIIFFAGLVFHGAGWVNAASSFRPGWNAVAISAKLVSHMSLQAYREESRACTTAQHQLLQRPRWRMGENSRVSHSSVCGRIPTGLSFGVFTGHSQANCCCNKELSPFSSPDLDVGDRPDVSLSLRAFDTFHSLHADGQIQEGMFDSSPAAAALWGRFTARVTSVLSVQIVMRPSKVLELQLVKSGFKMEVGQYVFLNCPAISQLEWHPFTMTSAPEEDFFSVHIRSAGDWTDKLIEIMQQLPEGAQGPKWAPTNTHFPTNILNTAKKQQKLSSLDWYFWWNVYKTATQASPCPP